MKPPDPKPMERKHIMTVKKTALKNIVGKDPMIMERIQDAVLRTHTIVVHTTHFLKLYLLHQYHQNLEMPQLTKDFIGICMRVVSNMPPKEKRRGRPPKESTTQVMDELDAFYKQCYEPLLGPNPSEMRASLHRINDMLQYEETDILKNIKNNIFIHFTDYCKEYVNKVFDLKATLKAFDDREDLSEQEKRLAKRNFSIELRKVKDDLMSPLGSPYSSLEKYHKWLNIQKPKLIFKDRYLKDSIYYDIVVRPLDYLPSMIHICSELEKMGRHVHAIPLRTSFIPSYATIDTTTLIMLMVDEDVLKFRNNVKKCKEDIWNAYFQLSNKAFHRKDYKFHGMITTDGVGCSVLFHRKDQNPEKLDEDNIATLYKEQYLDELPREILDTFKDKNIVGIDVGIDDILYCTDGELFYRYSANQRRKQTKKKKYMKIVDGLKKETYVDGLSVKEWETVLSLYNKYTCSVQEFRNYLGQKLPLFYTLKPFYNDYLLRKLRWNSYINRQRSEDKMINQIRKKFGDPDRTILVIGDWDQKGHNMAGKEPTKGKAIRKTLRKGGYEVTLMHEKKSSCTCHNCHGENKKFMYRESHKPKNYGQIVQVHGLLRCSSENGCGSLWNRDVCGSLNIRYLGQEAIAGRERPQAFT